MFSFVFSHLYTFFILHFSIWKLSVATNWLVAWCERGFNAVRDVRQIFFLESHDISKHLTNLRPRKNVTPPAAANNYSINFLSLLKPSHIWTYIIPLLPNRVSVIDRRTCCEVYFAQMCSDNELRNLLFSVLTPFWVVSDTDFPLMDRRTDNSHPSFCNNMGLSRSITIPPSKFTCKQKRWYHRIRLKVSIKNGLGGRWLKMARRNSKRPNQ